MTSATEHVADWNSHAITGWLPGGIRLNVPLISHIEDNLWVGGCINGITLDADFDTVVSLYKWEQYILGPNTTRHEFTMYDDHYTEADDQLHMIADIVVEALDRGDKVLVHCQAGVNRSNLITALALIKKGRTPEEAIALLREKRSEVVLANSTFEDWLLAQG